MRTGLILLSAVAALGLTVSAFAQCTFTNPCLTFEEKNEGGIGERNITFGHPAQGPSLTVTGHVVPVPVNGQEVNFSSTLTGGALWAKGGQSDVDACRNTALACPNGSITSVTISIPGQEFTDLILDPQKIAHDDSLFLSVLTNRGTEDFGPFGDHLAGDNYVTIKAEPGVEIRSVTVSDASGFEDLKQPRISGASIVPVPEPSTMMLLGSGTLLFARLLRRKLWH